MTVEIALALSILLASIALLALDLFRVDALALGVLLILAASGLVTSGEAFSSFSNPAIVTVGAIFIVSEGLLRTGAASFMSRSILRLTGGRETRLIVVIMATGGLLSAFINNVGATAMLLPAIIDIARQTEISPSKLCIPLAYGSLLGGLCTLIGTPANILVSNALSDRGFAPLAMFDFTRIGLTSLVVGIAYMALVGRHLLPDRPRDRRLRAVPSVRKTAREQYRLQERLFRVRILPRSPLVGMTILASELGKTLGLNVLSIARQERNMTAPTKNEVLWAGDVLLVAGKTEEILGAGQPQGLEIEREVGWEVRDLQSEDIGLAEVVLAPRSSLAGKTLEDMHFRDRFGMSVLAIWREGRPRRTGLADLPLRFGDALLVQGPWDRIRLLGEESDFLLLGPIEEIPLTSKVRWALGVLVLMIASLITGFLPVSLATSLGAALMVVTGCLTVDQAYEAVDWKVIFLIAGMLPLGLALERTGAARYLAGLIVTASGAQAAYLALAGLIVLIALLTQVLPNAATAVLMAPVALDAAVRMGADPRIALLCVAVAASASFVTPIGHQVNILAMGPGNYKFTDYTKVGLPLNLMVLFIILLALFASGPVPL
jgi:di/tricarboxylate transporter